MLWLDLETYCETDLKRAGTHRYAEQVEIMLVAYAFDDGPVSVWDCTEGEPMPYELFECLEDPDELITAHNANFEITVTNKVWGPNIALRRWRCTMAQALSHGLPGGLGLLCEIFDLDRDQAKMKEGDELVKLFCKPRPKTSKVRRATKETHPQDWATFKKYAGRDITSMRILAQKMPRWNYPDNREELAAWHHDMQVNARGFLVDTDLAEHAIRAVAKEKARLAERTQTLTGYDEDTGAGVRSTTQRDKLLKYILEYYGVDLPDMSASTLERRVNDPDLPQPLRELIAIRLEASTAASGKYAALTRSVSSDKRLRGTMQFCGASRTGREAGRIFQPQNMMRPTLKHDQIEFGIRAIKAECEDLFFTNIMEVAGNAVRGCIIAPEGKKLAVSDLAGIEGRGAAWIAREEWKLQAYRDYDTIIGVDKKGKPVRKGHDTYAMAYAKAFDVTPESVMEDKEKGTGMQRQIGKVMELMLQYEGGVGAFITGAASYGIDLDHMAEVAWHTLPQETVDEAEGFYDWTVKQRRSTFGLERKTFVTCDSLKRLWRGAHPNITESWKLIKEAVIDAIRNPNQVFRYNSLCFMRTGKWLRVRLPSGRYLCYSIPRVDDKGQISYYGVNNYTRKLGRIKTYGGKLLENFTQALCRDILFCKMPIAEAAGYAIVLHVHDELITETTDGDDEGLSNILALPIATLPGFPLAAAGFTADRYRKE